MNQQTANSKDEVLDLQQRLAAAELHGDTAAFDALLDAEFMAVGPLGFVLTREQWLERTRTGDLKYEAFSWGETSVRLYGDTAILIGEQSQKATYQGNPVPLERLRATLIAVRKGGRWLLAGLHLSPIQQPPGR